MEGSESGGFWKIRRGDCLIVHGCLFRGGRGAAKSSGVVTILLVQPVAIHDPEKYVICVGETAAASDPAFGTVVYVVARVYAIVDARFIKTGIITVQSPLPHVAGHILKAIR